jgi:hypothetical protein
MCIYCIDISSLSCFMWRFANTGIGTGALICPTSFFCLGLVSFEPTGRPLLALGWVAVVLIALFWILAGILAASICDFVTFAAFF